MACTASLKSRTWRKRWPHTGSLWRGDPQRPRGPLLILPLCANVQVEHRQVVDSRTFLTSKSRDYTSSRESSVAPQLLLITDSLIGSLEASLVTLTTCGWDVCVYVEGRQKWVILHSHPSASLQVLCLQFCQFFNYPSCKYFRFVMASFRYPFRPSANNLFD